MLGQKWARGRAWVSGHTSSALHAESTAPWGTVLLLTTGARNLGVDLRGVLGARLSAYFGENFHCRLAKCNCALVQRATACKLVRKVEKIYHAKAGAGFAFAQAGAASTFCSLSPGEGPLRLAHGFFQFFLERWHLGSDLVAIHPHLLNLLWSVCSKQNNEK